MTPAAIGRTRATTGSAGFKGPSRRAPTEDFEKDEHRKFGEDGFEMMVERVAGLERALGIYDLAKFTPH